MLRFLCLGLPSLPADATAAARRHAISGKPPCSLVSKPYPLADTCCTLEYDWSMLQRKARNVCVLEFALRCDNMWHSPRLPAHLSTTQHMAETSETQHTRRRASMSTWHRRRPSVGPTIASPPWSSEDPDTKASCADGLFCDHVSQSTVTLLR
ncbi:hypothetical protein BV20DRAFT_481532 [Pilatotrama ljubarskyi]|nr:hypothetical protein BV20DRAFT_481532 [Pilatotrama ljubarskyi]